MKKEIKILGADYMKKLLNNIGQLLDIFEREEATYGFNKETEKIFMCDGQCYKCGRENSNGDCLSWVEVFNELED